MLLGLSDRILSGIAVANRQLWLKNPSTGVRQSHYPSPDVEGARRQQKVRMRRHAQNQEWGSDNNTKEASRHAKGISCCVRSAGQASADNGSLSGKRNGATAWRHP